MARLYKGQQRLEDKAVELEEGRRENAAGIAELKEGQAEAKDAARRAADVGNAVNDRLTELVDESQVREAAYLASLAELGIDIRKQPPPRDPGNRTREDDL